MKREKAVSITKLFILIQMLLYISFLFFDITGRCMAASRNIKFIIIILCFCYVLFLGKSMYKGISFCIKSALFFTVISDLFILMLDYYSYGVITFILVQQLYCYRILLNHKASPKGNCNLRGKFSLRVLTQVIIALFTLLFLKYSGVILERLVILSVFYFICIITNTITAIAAVLRKFHNRSMVLFAIGMLLFLLCDINVGLFNLSGFIPLSGEMSNTLYQVSSVLMWTFYAPSQIFIALSASSLCE